MMIKTLDNVYINMEDFSGFTIGYPNNSDFTVMAMKELVDNQTAAIELGRYPSEKEAKDALEKMMEHQDDIKKAEFFGREEGFYYISNIFTMPKPSKNGKADVKRFMIEGREYTVPLKVIDEIHRQDMIDYGKNIAENREVTYEMLMIDSNCKEDKKNDKEHWESGSETVAEISDESNGEEMCFYGYGSYSYYHIDYTAERLSNIEELND